MSQRTLKGDVFGGLTAAVVALPLALAYSVARMRNTIFVRVQARSHQLKYLCPMTSGWFST